MEDIHSNTVSQLSSMTTMSMIMYPGELLRGRLPVISIQIPCRGIQRDGLIHKTLALCPAAPASSVNLGADARVHTRIGGNRGGEPGRRSRRTGTRAGGSRALVCPRVNTSGPLSL